MQLPATTNYQIWVREVDALLHEHWGHIDLSDAALFEPTKMLHADIQRGYATDHLYRPNERSTGWGVPDVVEAISQHYFVDEARILVTTGCSNSFLLVCRALVNVGDHVILETPYYQPLGQVLGAFGAQISLLPRGGAHFRFDLNELESIMTPDTRLLVLSNLHNPSGMLLDDDFLKQVADIANRNNCKVVVDEALGDYSSGAIGVRRGPAAILDDSFISLNSFSKVYGLSALRCGWMIASHEILARLRLVHAIFENSTSTLTHNIAAIIFKEFDRYTKHWTNILTGNRPLVQSFIERIQADELISGPLPDYGSIYFPVVTGLEDTTLFANWLAEKQKVVVTPGRFFDAPGHIRISFSGHANELREGLDRVERGLRAYRQEVTSS